MRFVPAARGFRAFAVPPGESTRHSKRVHPVAANPADARPYSSGVTESRRRSDSRGWNYSMRTKEALR